MLGPGPERPAQVNETTIMLDGSILGWGAGGISRYMRNVLVHMAQEPDLRIELFSNSARPGRADTWRRGAPPEG